MPCRKEREQPQLRDLLTLFINHVLNGMILQVIGIVVMAYQIPYKTG